MSKICTMLLAIVMSVQVSAYTPHELGGSRITASGVECQEGVTCALNGVPLGSIVEWNGQRFTVHDRCGIDGVLDIFMESHDKAIRFGRHHNQTIKVHVP